MNTTSTAQEESRELNTLSMIFEVSVTDYLTIANSYEIEQLIKEKISDALKDFTSEETECSEMALSTQQQTISLI